MGSMTRSRSPKAVLYESYVTAIDALPAYSHKCSPKKFTQHQLFACLVLKDFYDLTYRSTAAMLADCSDLREVIHLESVPHFTTLEKSAKRLLASAPFNRLLTTTIERAKEHRLIKPRPKLAAIDTSPRFLGTGRVEAHQPLLRQPAEDFGKTRAKTEGRLPPIPQVGADGRCGESLYPRRPREPGAVP